MKIFQSAAIATTLLGTLAFGWTDTAAAAQMEQASMALPALTIIFLPVYVAEDEGMWRNLGLDVTLHQITGLGSTNAMIGGSVDFAVQSGESLIRGNIRGRHMLGIALMADKEAFELVGRKQSFPGFDLSAPIGKRMAALKGTKVSVVSPNAVPDALVRYFTAKAGLDAKRDMTLVYMQPTEAIAALKSGAIDAAMLNFPWVETAVREGAIKLASGLTDLPELTPAIATTTTARGDYCDGHASVCGKLARGYVLAHKFIHEHPDEALKIALRRMPRANLSDFQKSMPLILESTPPLPRYEETAFAHTQQIMVVGGMLRKDEMRQSFTGMFTNKFVNIAANLPQ
jgi:sulfonate transport system substrate-binding protein